jgi:hypothetical protein
LTWAYNVSTDGTTIVGCGTDPLGQTEAWIATIPEPGELAPLVLLASLAARCRRARCIVIGTAAPLRALGKPARNHVAIAVDSSV